MQDIVRASLSGCIHCKMDGVVTVVVGFWDNRYKSLLVWDPNALDNVCPRSSKPYNFSEEVTSSHKFNIIAANLPDHIPGCFMHRLVCNNISQLLCTIRVTTKWVNQLLVIVKLCQRLCNVVWLLHYCVSLDHAISWSSVCAWGIPDLIILCVLVRT